MALRILEMTPSRVVDEKHANGAPDATGILSSRSSATNLDKSAREAPTGVLSSGSSATILKDGPPDGGLEAWMQVFGAFFMYFNTWGNSTNLLPSSDLHAKCFVLTLIPVSQESCRAMAAIRHGMRTQSSARAAHFRCPRSAPCRASSWCSWDSWQDRYSTRAISDFLSGAALC